MSSIPILGRGRRRVRLGFVVPVDNRLAAPPIPRWGSQRLPALGWSALVAFGALLAAVLLGVQTAAADMAPTGAFQTSVAIKIPPFHGLEPRLGLAYSSSGPSGWMGTGWNLSGLSTLRRQARGGGLPHWDTGDTFALDGQTLLACPGSDNGSPLARSPSCAHRLPGLAAYTTPVESYQRIASDQVAPDNGHPGHWNWLVWRTDGVKATYEPGLTTSHGVLDWRLTKVEDLSGNTVTYQWAPTQGEQVGVLRAIRYGDVEIRFQTESRPDPITVATGAGLVTNGTRLQVIDQWAGGQRIRAYALRYTTNADGSRQSLLQSVQQYGSDAIVDANGVHGGTALPATTFTTEGIGSTGVWDAMTPARVADWANGWPAGPDDSSRFNVSLSGGDQQVVPWPLARRAGSTTFPDGHEWVALDYNADGRTDIALVAPKETSVDVYVELAKPGGGYRGLHKDFTWPGYTNPVSKNPSARPLIGDVNGDDNDDLVITGLGPAVTVFGQDSLISTLTDVKNPQAGLRPQSDWMLGDVTGDGLADIVSVNKPAAPSTGACPGLVEVWAGAGTGKFTLVPLPSERSGCWPAAQSPRLTPAAHFQLADVNGDLKADLVGFQEANTNPDYPLHKAIIFTGIADGSGGFALSAYDTQELWAEAPHEDFHFPCGPGGSQPGNCKTTTTTHLPTLWSDIDADGRTDLTVLLVGGTKPPRGIEPDGDSVVAWTFFSQGDGSYRRSRGSTPFLNYDLRTVTETVASNNTTTIRQAARLVAADFNGDGAGDLGRITEHVVSLGGDAKRFDEKTLRAISDRQGSWASRSGSATVWSCYVGCGPPYPNPSPDRPFTTVGDINGDGQDDVLYAHSLGGASPLAALAADPTPRAPSARQVLSGDVNADGRQDLLYPTMTRGRLVENPDSEDEEHPLLTQAEIQVRVMRQRADGTHQWLAPVTVDVGTPALVVRNLAQKGWLVADVNCDQRTDLVNLDGDVTALLATGDHSWQLAASAPLIRGGRWSVADVNGDGCDDLIRVYASGSNTSSAVYAMLSTPNGDWEQDQATTPGVPDADPDADKLRWQAVLADTLRWQAVDVDGDQQSDLVHVNGSTGDVDTLLRRTCKDGEVEGPCWRHVVGRVSTSRALPGQATIFHPMPRCPMDGPFPPGWPFPSGPAQGPTSDTILAIGGDEPTWRGMDVNGDGDTDLARVSTANDGSVLVETLRSRGDGTFSPRTQRVAPGKVAGGAQAGADGQNWRPADIDHDGRTDLARVFTGCGAPAIQSLLSDGDGRWVLKTWTGSAASGIPASSSWSTGDWAGGGQTSAVRIEVTSGALTVAGFTSTAPLEIMTGTTNGLGAATKIEYSPGTSMSPADITTPAACRGPSGSSARPVVTGLTTTDAPSRTSDTTTTRYACLSYSAELRSPVAWKQTWSTHGAAANRPASTEHVVRDVYSSGIVQPVLDEVTDADGVVSVTRSHYRPVGEQPQINLLAGTAVSNCGEGGCARSTVELGHDEFGNLTSTAEYAAGSGRQRRTDTTYLHDHGRWLQALPQRTQTIDPAHPERLLRASMICYDGDTSADCTQLPAQPRGLATLKRAWDGDRYVITSQATNDPVGNQIRITDARGNPSTTDFDPQLHLYPIKACNALDQCAHQPIPWDRRADAPLRVIDANGAETRYSYDALGRPDTTTRTSGAVTKITYQTDATVGTVTKDDTTVPAHNVLPWTRTYSDGLGRTYLVERPSGDAVRKVQTRTEYSDGSTRPWRVHAPRLTDPPYIPDEPIPSDPTEFAADRGSASAPAVAPKPTGDPTVWDTMTYDSSGRPLRREHLDNSATTTRYRVRGGFGVTETRDETGHTQTRLTDGWGALSLTEQPSVTPGSIARTRYSYNPLGDLTAISDPAGNTVQNDFDTLGRKTSENDPDRGITTYRYDPAGNLVQQTDARNRVLEYGYDDLNRRIHKTDSATGTTSTWNYDEPGHGASIGRLTSIHDPSGTRCPQNTTRSLSYDASGNTTKDSRCVHGTTQAFHSSYDAVNRLQTLTYPDGEQLTYIYDGAGHLFSVAGYVSSMQYNARDQLISADYANHTTSRWNHNPTRGWLNSHIATTASGGPLFDDTTTHDPAGLVTDASSASNHTAETYGHDMLGRLTSVTGTWRQHLTYDDLGNLTHNSRVGTYVYPQDRQCITQARQPRCAGPHAVTAASNTNYQYDQAGNMTAANTTKSTPAPSRHYSVHVQDTLIGIAADQLGDPQRWPEIFTLNKGKPYPKPPGGRFTDPGRLIPGQRLLMPAVATSPETAKRISRQLTWNTEGQLSQIHDNRAGSVVNVYDADGARVQQTSRSGVTNFYGPLADWTPKTGLTKYIYAGQLLVARHQGPQKLWYTLDRLGSPRLTTDQTGSATNRQNYAPFGQTTTSTGKAEPIGYTGHHSIGDTELIDMTARAYDPKLARMLSADKIIPDAANPQSLNRYSYAYNSPVNYTDPSGHFPIQTQESGVTVDGRNLYGMFGEERLIGNVYVSTKMVTKTVITIYGTLPTTVADYLSTPSATPIVAGTGDLGVDDAQSSIEAAFDSADVRASIEAAFNAVGAGRPSAPSPTTQTPTTNGHTSGDFDQPQNQLTLGQVMRVANWAQVGYWRDPMDRPAQMSTFWLKIFAFMFQPPTPSTGAVTSATAAAKNAVQQKGPFVPYSREHYGGAATNGPAAQTIRTAAEGQPCPACNNPMVSGTRTAPVPEHQPPLVEHYYFEGGWEMTPAEAQAYAANRQAFSGAMCYSCQQEQGGYLSSFARIMKQIVELSK